ncbi:MAG: hypothetical protein EOM25_14940 [Deltaproteobacteria bacterium]|nr:hypothetical protein [Deltaproteobacteria bacterium]
MPKIALCLLHDRIAPRYDQAELLLVLTVAENGDVLRRDALPVDDTPVFDRCRLLAGMGVRAMICGGLLDECRTHLSARGITVFDNVIGDTDAVVRAYADGSLKSGTILDDIPDSTDSRRDNGHRTKNVPENRPGR